MSQVDATLVLIDDEPGVLAATARILTQAGYRVITGGTAAEAFDLTHKHRPALVLLDVMLPDGDGMQVARRLKSDPALVSVFVVLLSGHKTSGEDQAAGLAGGLADGYIARPFSRPEFLARVDALLRLRAAQEALREALREKDALLRETHHRVKNNLGLIVSLMRLTAGRSVEAETKAVLKEMQDRIHSVILLNETLYKSASYTRVKLADYLRQIATHGFQAQNARSGEVSLSLDLAPTEVATAVAIPCGLILNELITNSLKHAFPDHRAGEVRVSLKPRPDGQVSLCVRDNGVGLPEDLAIRQRHSLGLQLVGDLTKQLQGALEIGPGAAFSITFMPSTDDTPSTETGDGR